METLKEKLRNHERRMMMDTTKDLTFIVTETCPYCGAEVEIHGWDTDRDGFKAYCPYCGNRLMLCDECLHSRCPDCDYDSVTDSCKHNPARA